MLLSNCCECYPYRKCSIKQWCTLVLSFFHVLLVGQSLFVTASWTTVSMFYFYISDNKAVFKTVSEEFTPVLYEVLVTTRWRSCVIVALRDSSLQGGYRLMRRCWPVVVFYPHTRSVLRFPEGLIITKQWSMHRRRLYGIQEQRLQLLYLSLVQITHNPCFIWSHSGGKS